MRYTVKTICTYGAFAYRIMDGDREIAMSVYEDRAEKICRALNAEEIMCRRGLNPQTIKTDDTSRWVAEDQLGNWMYRENGSRIEAPGPCHAIVVAEEFLESIEKGAPPPVPRESASKATE